MTASHAAPHTALADSADLWRSCREFHGHTCPGLALGFRVAVEALALLGQKGRAVDEEVVCVAETDSCAVDAIQLLTGCTLGKGGLVLRLRGKHAFSFFTRGKNNAFRIVWHDRLEGLSREERTERFLTAPGATLFSVSAPGFPLPETARMHASLPCAACGEKTAEPFLRLHTGKLLCPDCYTPPLRATL